MVTVSIRQAANHSASRTLLELEAGYAAIADAKSFISVALRFIDCMCTSRLAPRAPLQLDGCRYSLPPGAAPCMAADGKMYYMLYK